MNTQPAIEDIGAVVSRFQAWSGTQAKGAAKPAVREVSYEEALRSGRHKKTPVESSKSQAKPSPVQNRKPRRVQHRKAHVKSDAIVPVVKPDFRQALTEQVAIVPAVQPFTIDKRSTALSVRMTATEQALLKSRADEANLTVSAYMRKCVLEVDELREQVKHSLAVNHQPPARSQNSIFESAARFVRRLLNRNAAAFSVRV